MFYRIFRLNLDFCKQEIIANILNWEKLTVQIDFVVFLKQNFQPEY